MPAVGILDLGGEVGEGEEGVADLVMGHGWVQAMQM